jgi:hypothetical protein
MTRFIISYLPFYGFKFVRDVNSNVNLHKLCFFVLSNFQCLTEIFFSITIKLKIYWQINLVNAKHRMHITKQCYRETEMLSLSTAFSFF